MESMMIISVGLSIAAIMLAIASSVVGVFAWIELKSFMKSTHKIQYIPFDPASPQEIDNVLNNEVPMIKETKRQIKTDPNAGILDDIL